MSDDAPAPLPPRRSWLRLFGLLCLVALVGGFVFWLVKPKTVTATALFQVSKHSPSIVKNQTESGIPDADYEILKKTQIALLHSKYLMSSALRNPNVSSSPVLASERDKEEWLQDHLEVSFPQNGSILAIELRGPESQANDLRLIVDAVADAYKKEVLGSEAARRLTKHDMLERSLQNLNSEIKRKYEDYLDITKGMGRSDGNVDIEMQLDMKRMNRMDEELAQLERDQLRIDTGGDGKDSKFVAARMAQLAKRQNELLKTMQKRSEKSVDLIVRKSELDRLESFADELSTNLEKMDIDAQSPSSIWQVQQAMIEPKQVAGQ